MRKNICGMLINNPKNIELIHNEDDTFELLFNAELKDVNKQEEYNAKFHFPHVDIGKFIANKNDDDIMFDVTILGKNDNKCKWVNTGYFIEDEHNGFLLYEYKCNKCNAFSYFSLSNNKIIGGNFCPNCGADMIGDK